MTMTLGAAFWLCRLKKRPRPVGRGPGPAPFVPDPVPAPELQRDGGPCPEVPAWVGCAATFWPPPGPAAPQVLPAAPPPSAAAPELPTLAPVVPPGAAELPAL